MAKKFINPPSLEDEKSLMAALENSPESCLIRGRKYNFRMLTGFAQHKISKIIIGEGQDSKDTCKCVAAAWLNGYFSLKFLWWIVWRWFYYVRQYNEDELMEAVNLIKKKLPSQQYWSNTILLIGMRETMMAMNKNEVSLILREKYGDNGGNSAKSDNGLQDRSAS